MDIKVCPQLLALTHPPPLCGCMLQRSPFAALKDSSLPDTWHSSVFNQPKTGKASWASHTGCSTFLVQHESWLRKTGGQKVPHCLLRQGGGNLALPVFQTAIVFPLSTHTGQWQHGHSALPQSSEERHCVSRHNPPSFALELDLISSISVSTVILSTACKKEWKFWEIREQTIKKRKKRIRNKDSFVLLLTYALKWEMLA